MPTERELGAKLAAAIQRGPFRDWRPMYTGRLLDDGTITLAGAAAGKVWVRADPSSREETQVWSGGKGAARVNMPVWVGPNVAGELELKALNETEAAQVLGGGAAASLLPAVTPEANPNILIGGDQFRPGRMRLSDLGGLYVYVEPFHYDGGFWPGGDFELTPPSTASTQAWCALALNPADGALYQFTGTHTALPIVLAQNDLAAIAITNGYIPVGAIVLQNGQTTITGNEQRADFRYHYAQVGGDVSGFVTLTPDSDTRNTIQPSGDHPAIIVKNNGSQTDAPLQVQTSAGAVMAQISAAGGLTVNEQGADADTRIEGDTDANLLFVDASTDRVGIGTATPGVKLDVSGAITGTGLDINGDGTIRKLLTDASTELTIASGAITVTQTFHRVDTEADAASDNLDTINGGADGQFLVIRAEDAGREVVVTTAGNITTSDGNNVALDEVYKFLLLIYDGNRSKWNVVGGGGGGGSGSYYQTVKDNGSAMTQRAALNLIGGTDIALTIADDAGNGETDVTIAFTGSGSGSTPYSLCQGRLTLTSGTPVTTSNVTAAGTVYFTPYKGNQVGVYSGAAWSMHTLTELSISLSGLLPHSIHDVFLDYNGGTPALALQAWTAGTTAAISGATNATPISITSNSHGLSTNDIVTISGVGGNTAANGTFRITNTGANTFTLQTLAGANVAGSGAYTSGGDWYKEYYSASRSTALTTQDGIYVLTGATDWRYLGTVRITGTAAQTEDSLTNRFVWNYYNRTIRKLYAYPNVASWTYGTNSYRYYNNDAANRIKIVNGVAEDAIVLNMNARLDPGTFIDHGISINSLGPTYGSREDVTSNTVFSVNASDLPGLGFTFYALTEAASGTSTVYGLSYQSWIAGAWPA